MTRPMDNLKVRIAPGADLTADRSTWTWVDITGYLRNTIQIQHGRRSESAQPGPDEATITVQNDDGEFAPDNPLGPWYPDLDEGTPLQIYWDTTDNIRFDGNITDLPIQWRVPTRTALSTIRASGPLERMQQGEQPLDSPLFRSISAHPDVVAYWPCEDGRDATRAASPIAGVPALRIPGGDFASIEGPPGSQRLVRAVAGNSAPIGSVPNHTPAGTYVVQTLWRMDETPGGGRAILNAFTTSDDLSSWRVSVSGSDFTVQARDADDSLVINDSEAFNDEIVGQWLRAVLVLHQDGGDVDWSATLYTVDVDATVLHSLSGTESSTEMGRITDAGVGSGGTWSQDRYFGHIGVFTGAFATVAHLLHDPFHGWTGERAAARFARLCSEEGLSYTVSPSVTEGMLCPPGVENLARTDDHADLDITGDIDLRAVILPDDWADGTSQYVLAKYYTEGDQRSYALRITPDGFLSMDWSTDGALGAPLSQVPSTVRPLIGSGKLAIRATLDVDNGSTGHDVTFYTADPDDLDGDLDGTWAQLGDVVTGSGTTSIHSGTAPLEAGGLNAFFAGIIYAAQVRDGIDGTIAANPDFTAETVGTTSFSDSTGKTWELLNDATIARQDDSMPMGPQQIDTLTANLQSIPATDGGRLTEHEGGFRYRVRTSLYNQDDALTITPQPHMPTAPRPTRDNQRIRNDVTATSPFGSSAHATDEGSIAKRGRLADAITVNPQNEDQLRQIAWWRLHLGTAPGMRWPNLPLRLSPSNPDLIADWLAVRVGDRISVDHEFTQIPGVDVGLLVDGWSESWDSIQWDVSLNCVPASPYEVAVFGTSRFDTAGSETVGSFDAGADTSLTVVSGTDRDGLRLWGGDGDYASTPDHASLDITGDIDISIWVLAPETKLPRRENLITKWEQLSGDEQSYSLTWEADRTLRFWWTTDGTDATQAFVESSDPTPIPGSTGLAVRVTVDVDNGSSDADVTFWTADSIDGPWTQLGEVVNPGSTISLYSGTAPLAVGAQDPSGPVDTFRGFVRAARVRDGIDGTIVADPDFSAQAAGTTSFSDSAGRTWTVQGEAYIFHTRPWVNSTDHASEFPFEIEVSGVRLNVTGISGTDPEQTFTVDATPTNGVEKTIPDGSAVRLP